LRQLRITQTQAQAQTQERAHLRVFARTLSILLCVAFIFFPGAMGAAVQLEPVDFEEDLAYESLFKIAAADFVGVDRDYLVALGRNYLEHKAFVTVFNWSDHEWQVVWGSDNLLEEQSPIFMAVGSLHSSGEQGIVIMTNHRLYIYTYGEEGFVLSSHIYHTLLPQEINVADINGDGIDELLVVRVGEVQQTYIDMVVEVYRLGNEGLVKLGSSPLMGNIRALTGYDLDGDGRQEVLVETGVGSKPGVFSVLCWTSQDSLVEKYSVEGPLKTVPYGLDADFSLQPEQAGDCLITADSWGRVNILDFRDGEFRSVVEELRFNTALVGVAVGDFDGDGLSDLVVGGYPAKLIFLKNTVGEDGFL